MQYRKYGVALANFSMFIALLTGCGRNPAVEQISSSRTETVIGTVEKGQAATKESVPEAIADTEAPTTAPEDYIKTNYMADIVKRSGYSTEDFFIWSATGTKDFDYCAFKKQIMNMASQGGDIFRITDNEAEGNLSFREAKGYAHDYAAADEYMYNGLLFLWS